MITKLTEEAGEEAEHKAWCDGELQENKQTRDTKTSEVRATRGSTLPSWGWFVVSRGDAQIWV